MMLPGDCMSQLNEAGRQELAAWEEDLQKATSRILRSGPGTGISVTETVRPRRRPSIPIRDLEGTRYSWD